ncbi:glycosyltransferase family 2 protein [Candidatus Bathyarchaeota archaeon]|nr:glycosyltransferase family 2 protein [Candidatus Bathyarchaeota archaeon]MBS7628680.1 glycosyltransferase family 2 protein [Candidatus Bathyarchaeota archaeon]
MDIGESDLLVGLPSLNCAHTIGYVLHQVAKGLTKYFPNHKSVVLVSDGGSDDGTREVAESIKTGDVSRIFTRYVGVSGKGSAVKAILEAASILNVKAIALFDSDVRSITPEWCRIVFEAAMKHTDLVTPFYARHRYDGTITNNLCYPFTRAVYGLRVRQPIGGDFGLSNTLASKLLESPLFDNKYVQRFGVDIFITHTAIANGFNVGEAFLGSKVHECKDPGAELSSMFIQVVGSMFTCAKVYEKHWVGISGSRRVPLLSYPITYPGPEPVRLDASKLLKVFRYILTEKRSLLGDVLGRDLLKDLTHISRSSRPIFPPETWAKTVYSFASAFKSREGDDLLDTLRGIWLGKICSFINQTEGMADDDADDIVEKEAEIFEDLKPFLISRYTGDV